MLGLRHLRRILCQKELVIPKLEQIRAYSVPKRFYKKTGVLHSDDGYEIILDQRKLRTPRGKVLKVQNEILALAVAAEWDAQKDIIQQSTMHLEPEDGDSVFVSETSSSLCSTAQDNPNNVNKHDAVKYIINFFETDTVLFHSRAEDLYELQLKEWGAAVDWFKKRFDVEVEATRDIMNPFVPEKTKLTIERHLLSYNLSAIHGFLFAVEALKSVILTLCCVEHKLNVDQAVLLTRLEEEYQTGFWGRVEWAHDTSQADLLTRVAAGIIFIQLNSMSEKTQSKLISVI